MSWWALLFSEFAPLTQLSIINSTIKYSISFRETLVLLNQKVMTNALNYFAWKYRQTKEDNMLKQDLYDFFGGVLNVQSNLIHILLK